MKKNIAWALGGLIISVLWLSACAPMPPQTAKIDSHTRKIALDWAGGYFGQMPAAGAQPERAIALWLAPNNAYRLDLGDWGSRGMQSFSGKAAWQAGRGVDLIGAPTMLAHWQVREGGLQGGANNAITLQQAAPLVGALALPQAWVLQSLPGASLPNSAKPPELSFSMAGRVAGFDGCNRLMGGFTFNPPNGFTFGTLAGTLMACVQPDNPDRAFRAMLEHVTAAQIQGETLILSNAQGQVIAELRAVSSQALPSSSRKNSASRPE